MYILCTHLHICYEIVDSYGLCSYTLDLIEHRASTPGKFGAGVVCPSIETQVRYLDGSVLYSRAQHIGTVVGKVIYELEGRKAIVTL